MSRQLRREAAALPEPAHGYEELAAAIAFENELAARLSGAREK